MRMAERIRLARRKAGMSQALLASHIGAQRSAVANWESVVGASPAITNLALLAKTTHVAFEWLATGRGDMTILPHIHDVPAVDADLVDDPQERRLLRAFRGASARARISLLEMAEELTTLRTGKRPPEIR